MKYRSFPRQPGLEVSALGFGGLRLPAQAGDPASIDEAAATSLLREAIEAGVTYVDTAWSAQQGRGEPFIGRALQGGWRERVRLAAKLPAGQVARAGDLERLLGERLERLATDHLDVCLLQGLTLERWSELQRSGGLEALDRARADGRIGALGVAHDGTPAELEGLLAAHGWDLCQLSLDLLDPRGEGREALRCAAGRGVGVVVAEPLRGGALSRPPPVVREAWAGSERPWSPAEWALRWAWDAAGVVTVLCGTGSAEHLRATLRAAAEAEPLPARDLERLEAVRLTYRTRRRVPCTSCGGCTVCARQIPVADLFSLYNDAMFDSREAAAEAYRQTFLAEGHGADQCIACQVCQPLCAGGIPIPERLREAHDYLAAR